MSPPEPGISRRALLQVAATGALAAGLTSACTGSGSTPPPATGSTGPGTMSSGSPSSSPRPPTTADWAALAAGLTGSLVLPGASGFTLAHRLYDPRWDSLSPAAVLRAGSAQDVVEAVRFAGRHGVRLTPRGGGHSYLGASSPSGALVVDTRALSAVHYDAAAGLASVGAGAQLVDVYAGLAAHGRSIPAGTCPTVGVAGLAQGGGFGVFDRAYGLTCDVVTELDVVTAAGTVLTVDAERQPDLFWALRGGGGGDFGVVTGLRMRTFRTADVGRWYARWSWSHASAVVEGWQRFVRAAPDRSWANLHLDVLATGERSVVVIGVTGAGSQGPDLAACVAQVGVEPDSTSSSVHSHLDTVLSLAGCSAGSVAACHLPPQGTFARESFVAGSSVPAAWLSPTGVGALVAAVADARAWSGERHAICDPLGGAVARVPTGATAFPWRGSPFTVQWYAKLAPSGPATSVRSAQAWVDAARAATARSMPGAYVNYPSAGITDPATYHGATYARLRQVKAAYDPGGFFRPPSGVPG